MQVFANIRTALRLLDHRQRARWALLVPFGIAHGLIEAGTAGAVFALVAVLHDTSRVTDLALVRNLYERLPPEWQREQFLIQLFLGITVLLLAVRALMSIAMVIYRGRILAHDKAKLAVRLFRGYMSLPYAVHLQRNTAEHVHRLNTAVQVIYDTVLTSTADMLRQLMTAAGVLTVLLIANPVVTLIVAIAFMVWVIATSRVLRAVLHRLGRLADEWAKRRQRTLQEGLAAFKEARMLGRERHFTDLFAQCEQHLVSHRWRVAIVNALPRLLIETGFGCLLLVAFAFLPSELPRNVALLPLLGLYAYAAFRLLPTTNAVVDCLNQLQGATHPLQRITADLQLIEQHAEMEDDEPGHLELRRELRVEDVAFRYEESADLVLHGVSFTVRRGEMVGIAGANGAGKSTLLHLIAGLFEPTSGSVRVDGVDIRSCRRAWQRRIGYVPQNIHLVDGSLRTNIALGLAPRSIDNARLEEAAHGARFERAPGEPMSTALLYSAGEDGHHLSGGQRQRIAIARALYNRPSLLLFDEATAALDRKTQEDLLESIEQLRGKKTMLIISHSPSVLSRCHRVLVLDRGQLIADGPWDEVREMHADRDAAEHVPRPTGTGA